LSAANKATPTVLQFEASECALAALAILLGYHGCHVTLEELRQENGVSRDGVSLSRVKALAAAYGYRARVFRKELDALAEMPLPCMAFINFNHMVVVEAVETGGFLLNDPACGHYLFERAEMDRSYSGLALILEPTPSAQQRPRHSPARAAIPLRAPAWLWLAPGAALLGAGAETAAVLSAPAIPAGLSIAAIAALAALAALLLAGRQIDCAGTDWAWERLSRQSSGYLANRSPALLQQLLLAPQQLAEKFFGPAGQSLLGMSISLVPLTALAMILPPAAGLAFTALLLLGAANGLIHLRRRSAWRRLLGPGNDASLLGAHTLAELDMLQLSGNDDKALIRSSGAAAQAVTHEQRLARAQSLSSALALGAMAAVIAATAVLAQTSQRPAAVCLAALAMLPWLALPDLLRAWFALPRLRAALADLALVPPSPPHGAPAAPPAPGQLRLEGLGFAYGAIDKPLLQGIDLRLEPGQRLALSGPPGSGKTSLGKLIAGTLTPSQGRVDAGGRVLMVTSAPVLFAGSVADNLSLWQQGFDDRDLLQALELAALADEVAARGGLSARVEQYGGNWSGGQRRRLVLARALLRKPRIIVIDEALDGIDRDREAAILDALRQRGISVVLVTQRRESVALCDAVLTLGAAAAPVAAAASHTEEPPAEPPDSDTPAAAAWGALTEIAGALRCALPAAPQPGMSLAAAARNHGLLLRPVALDGAPLPRQSHPPLLARRGNQWYTLLPDWRGSYADPHQAETLYAVHRRAGTPVPRMRAEATIYTLGLLGQWGGWLLGAWAVAAATMPALASAVIAIGAGTLAAERAQARWHAVLGLEAGTCLWGRVLRYSAGWVKQQHLGNLAAAAAGAIQLARDLPRARVQTAVMALATATGAGLLASQSFDAALALLVLLAPFMGAMIALHWIAARARERDNPRRITADRFVLQMMPGFAEFRALGSTAPLLQRWRRLSAGPLQADRVIAACQYGSRWLRRSMPLAAALLLGPHGTGAALAAVTCAAAGILAEQAGNLLLARREMRRIAAQLDGPDETEGKIPDVMPQTLSARGVRFAYGDTPVLRDIDLQLRPGEVVALTAPSGAGKTTLLRLLLGFEQPQQGSIRFGDADIAQLDRMALRADWAAVQQDERLAAGLLRRHLGGLTQGAMRRAWIAARQVGLADDIAAMPMGMATPASSATLSTGQEHKVLLGRALVRRPSLIVLDEALLAMDIAARRRIVAAVRELGAACVVVTHDADTLALCDRQLELTGGLLEETVLSPPEPPAPAPACANGDSPVKAASPYRQRALELADSGAQLDHLPALLPLPFIAAATGVAVLILGIGTVLLA